MVEAVLCGARMLDLSRPRIMGVLNVTPDSFSDGGQLYRNGRVDTDALLARAEQMLAEGADIIDVGGESTRPGAAAVSEAEELDRVVTAVEALAQHCDTIISVDSSTPSVMRESARCGAGLLNDVRGFQRPQALQAAAESGLALCVMHMQGEPDTMQTAPAYSDVLQDISQFLSRRLADVSSVGIDLDRVIIDPGFGFGKTAEQNFELLARLEVLCNQDQPILVGLSRKSMITTVLDRPPEQRMVASVALALMAVERGARIVRVHDVAATFDALSMWQTTRHALSQSEPS